MYHIGKLTFTVPAPFLTTITIQAPHNLYVTLHLPYTYPARAVKQQCTCVKLAEQQCVLQMKDMTNM